MGCGSSNAFNNELSIPDLKDKKEENEKKEKEKENEVINNKSEIINPPANLILSDNLSNIYVDYQFNFNPTDQNLTIYYYILQNIIQMGILLYYVINQSIMKQ